VRLGKKKPPVPERLRCVSYNIEIRHGKTSGSDYPWRANVPRASAVEALFSRTTTAPASVSNPHRCACNGSRCHAAGGRHGAIVHPVCNYVMSISPRFGFEPPDGRRVAKIFRGAFLAFRLKSR